MTLMETHYQNNLKILLIVLLLFTVLFVFDLKWACPFLKYIHILCPGCGLTRSIKALLRLDIVSAIKYNILIIPLVIFIVGIIIDSITKKDRTIKIFSKNSFIILIFLIFFGILRNI